MFFTFDQNNSGGSFHEDNNVSHYVIVEAETYEEANERAKSIGLYFDGMGDCPCCGNRWYEQYSTEDGFRAPKIYGSSLAKWIQERQKSFRSGSNVRVHLADGRKVRIDFVKPKKKGDIVKVKISPKTTEISWVKAAIKAARSDV